MNIGQMDNTIITGTDKKGKGLLLAVLILTLVAGCNSAEKESLPVGDNSPAQQNLRVLFDTDINNEIDDQHALAYLLFSGDAFSIEGVTVNSTSEDQNVELDFKEAKRILKLGQAYGLLPLKKGANGTFRQIREQVNQEEFDGASAGTFIIDRATEKNDSKLVLLAVGKLTNIALALEKEPRMASRTRLVLLGPHYPAPGECNQEAGTSAMNYLLNSDIPFEMVTVRYGKRSGTGAVRVFRGQIEKQMPGKGPHISESIEGRHGGQFTNFGDYSADLFKHAEMNGDPPSRALFDMAAAAILKNPDWAEANEIPAPVLIDGEWKERPNNSRKITVWEDFHIYSIISDFFETMRDPAISYQS